MYTVVVVDDEEELRKALIRKVDWEEIGFQVIGEAENGIEALELVEKLEPDLLLSDIKMPFMSGIELARQVREIRPTMHIAFLSGYDDFTYAQQAIQYNIVRYILKPISAAELTQELIAIREKIDKNFEEFASQSLAQEQLEISGFLIPLLLDGHRRMPDREKRLLDSAVSCGLRPKNNRELVYTVMVTSILDTQGNNCTTRASVNAIDTILRKYIKYASFFSEGRVISLIMASQTRMDKYLHILVEDIAQSVRRIMGLTCSIGISRTISTLSGCHEACVEATNAMGYSRYTDSSVHFIADEERADDFDQEFVQETITEIENLIRGGSRQELEQYLQNFFVKMQEKRVLTNVVHFMMIQLVSAVFRVVYAVAGKEAVWELQFKSPLQNVDFLEETDKIGDKYIEFCMTSRDLIAAQRKKSSEVLCDKALEIIHTRYMENDLSLVSISSEIAVSPNYLSAVIKKLTGSTFIDLLTKKRIEKSKELLLGTSMKIREISEKCGYNDQHYFSYCFKKVMGVSPNNCRRENEEENQQK